MSEQQTESDALAAAAIDAIDPATTTSATGAQETPLSPWQTLSFNLEESIT